MSEPRVTLPPDDAWLPEGTPEHIGESIMLCTPRGLSDHYYAKLIALAIRRERAQLAERDRMIAALQEALRRSDRSLDESREMMLVLEDHGGHDGLQGKGYLATLDHLDEARAGNRSLLAVDTRADERIRARSEPEEPKP